MLHKILFIYIISTQNQSSTNKDFDTPKFSTRPSSDDCLKFYYNLNKSCEHFQCNFPCVFETFGNSNWTNAIKAIGTLDCSSYGKYSKGKILFDSSIVNYIYFDQCYSSSSNQIGSFVIANEEDSYKPKETDLFLNVYNWRSVLVTTYGEFHNCVTTCYQMKDSCNLIKLDKEILLSNYSPNLFIFGIFICLGLGYLFYTIKRISDKQKIYFLK